MQTKRQHEGKKYQDIKWICALSLNLDPMSFVFQGYFISKLVFYYVNYNESNS